MKNLFLVLFFISFEAAAQQNEFQWLIGTWQEEENKSFEVWKTEDNFLVGECYKLANGAKLISEQIQLIKKGNDFFYVPNVAGPQGPIEFKITSFDKNSFVAENPKHDFPQKIIYKRMDETHLQAFIQKSDNTMMVRFFFTLIK